MEYKLKIGDKVQLNPEIVNYRHGQGAVDKNEVGELIRIYDHDIQVNFPSHKAWSGILGEVVLYKRTLEELMLELDELIIKKELNGI